LIKSFLQQRGRINRSRPETLPQVWASKKRQLQSNHSNEKLFSRRTFGAVSATGQDNYHKGFYPLCLRFLHAEFNNIESVKNLITKTPAPIITEPIQGEGGLIPANIEFLQELREICTKNDILLVFDEVQTGMAGQESFLRIKITALIRMSSVLQKASATVCQ
jgi:acetylornithine/succinyldiaminopimelate/putrescine aminotransferase